MTAPDRVLPTPGTNFTTNSGANPETSSASALPSARDGGRARRVAPPRDGVVGGWVSWGATLLQSGAAPRVMVVLLPIVSLAWLLQRVLVAA